MSACSAIVFNSTDELGCFALGGYQKEVIFFDWQTAFDGAGISLDANGNVTNLDPVSCFGYKIVSGLNVITASSKSARVNGVPVFTDTVTIPLGVVSSTNLDALNQLIAMEKVVMILRRNGSGNGATNAELYEVYGIEDGLYVSTSDGESGATPEALNKNTLVFTGAGTQLPCFVLSGSGYAGDEAIVNGILS